MDELGAPHGEGISSMTEYILDYITLCGNSCFPNNKAWIASNLKEVWNKKEGTSKVRNRNLISARK